MLLVLLLFFPGFKMSSLYFSNKIFSTIKHRPSLEPNPNVYLKVDKTPTSQDSDFGPVAQPGGAVGS